MRAWMAWSFLLCVIVWIGAEQYYGKSSLFEGATHGPSVFGTLPPYEVGSGGRAAHDERWCLAIAMCTEACGEGEIGQRAVAAVVFNRLREPRRPRTICGVVSESQQFDGWMRRESVTTTHRNWPAVRTLAARIEDEVARGAFFDPTHGANHFHAAWMQRYPTWASRWYRTTTIGNHVFYRLPMKAASYP